MTTVNGSASVVGVGTAWLGQVNAGDLFTVDRVTFYKVATVGSDGSLALATPYGGVSAADQIYGIVLNFDTASVNFLSAAVALLTPTDRVTAVFGRSGAVIAQAGDYTAAQVAVTPGGGIGATEVQGALAELDTEKAALAGAAFTGTVTLSAGTIAAAPLALQSGALLSVPVEGAVEFDGNNVYVGVGCCDTARKTLAFTDSDITGNAANVTGIVAIDHGGTGAATAPAALVNLGAAPLASPALTGTPTAPTVGVGDSSSQIATTAYVKSQNYITLAEAPVQSVAGKIGAVTLVVTDISGAAPLSSPNFIGTPTGPTASPADASNHLATTAFVKSLGYITAASAPVVSVAGKTGAVTLVVGDVSGAAPLASPGFTGTPTAPTPAGADNSTALATTAFVKAQTLNDLGAPTAALSLDGQRLVNVADPSGDQDAATKAYVDSVAQGLDAKASVRAATTADITLSGTQMIDGVALGAGDRVLVKNQANPAENGIYAAAAGAWGRSADANTWNELVSAYVFVEGGMINADAGFTCTVQPGGTLGTTPVTWVQFSGAGQVIAGTGLLKDGNTLSVDTSVIAALASPALSGTPTAPTAATSDNSTTVATTAFVKNQGYVTASTAPVLSVAGKTGNVTLVVGDVSGAAPLASPALTGTPTAPTQAASDNSTKIATTAFVKSQNSVSLATAYAAALCF